ncbi:MAG: hypothetical protein ACRENU_15590 [Gemmatimonadaceae bacterium]
MSASTEPHGIVASVLVIAADPVIEALVGELVAFAGYRPVFDPAAGAAGEAIRRVRPDVVLLDTSLTRSMMMGCLLASEEVGTRPILMSSSVTASELKAQADARSVPFFVLPGGPLPLGSLIDRTLGQQPHRLVITVPEEPRSVHPAICAALASVGRARMLVLHAQVAVAQSRLLYDEMITETKAARQSAAALKAAVVDYARQLRAANVTEERSLALVRDALFDCASIVGAEEAMATLLDESADWTREVYRAA